MDNMKKKRILILGGKTGLLGVALTSVWKEDATLELVIHGKDDFDVLDFKELYIFLNDISPDIIVNTVAFNQLNLAEEREQKALEVNDSLIQQLVNYSLNKDVHLVNFSTYMVFDGKRNIPYTEEDDPSPINVFGKSKLMGDRRILQSGLKNYLIIRTSWLFGPGGHNFVDDFLSLIKKEPKVVACHNKIIAPTYTKDLANFALALLKRGTTGIVNITNSGQATMCEIAQEIVRITGAGCIVEPEMGEGKDGKLGAKIPDYGVLDLSKVTKILGKKPRSWMLALRDYLFSLSDNN